MFNECANFVAFAVMLERWAFLRRVISAFLMPAQAFSCSNFLFITRTMRANQRSNILSKFHLIWYGAGLQSPKRGEEVGRGLEVSQAFVTGPHYIWQCLFNLLLVLYLFSRLDFLTHIFFVLDNLLWELSWQQEWPRNSSLRTWAVMTMYLWINTRHAVRDC